MTRGRKPAPTATKKLEGNPGKRKLNADEPRFDRASTAPPEHLSGVAKSKYEELVLQLSANNVITVVDVGALEAYCEAYATWLESKKEAAKRPVILNSRNDSVMNPQMRIANMAVQQMIKLASELGITPASRSRIKLPQPDGENEILEFLKNG
ncbi:MAG: phage terminase small subunit P27 family [Anaerolineae bacterium]